MPGSGGGVTRLIYAEKRVDGAGKRSRTSDLRITKAGGRHNLLFLLDQKTDGLQQINELPDREIWRPIEIHTILTQHIYRLIFTDGESPMPSPLYI
jgi:hypothetical protein